MSTDSVGKLVVDLTPPVVSDKKKTGDAVKKPEAYSIDGEHAFYFEVRSISDSEILQTGEAKESSEVPFTWRKWSQACEDAGAAIIKDITRP